MIRVLSIKQEHLTDEPVMKILSSSFRDSSVPSKKPTDNSSSNLSKFGLRDHSSFERFPGSWAPCVKSLSHSRQSHRLLLLKAQEKKKHTPSPFEGLFYGEVASLSKNVYKNLNASGFRGRLFYSEIQHFPGALLHFLAER